MILTGRLKGIADAVLRSNKVADIGTDHGYIPLYLVQNNIADTCIATDISVGSLKKAETLIKQYDMEERIQTRLGNGLSVLNLGEVDIIIIAGMGGLLIADILKADEAIARGVRYLILQPMTAAKDLRKWLVNNKFKIEDEDLVKENHRIYEIITASYFCDTKVVKPPQDEIYYEIGWKLIEKKHPLLEEYFLMKVNGINRALSKLRASNSTAAKKRMQELEETLSRYKEVYQWEK